MLFRSGCRLGVVGVVRGCHVVVVGWWVVVCGRCVIIVGGGLVCGRWIRVRAVQVVPGWGADVRGQGVVVQAWGVTFSSCCRQAVSFMWLL